MTEFAIAPMDLFNINTVQAAMQKHGKRDCKTKNGG
jgi:hypothetical protein